MPRAPKKPETNQEFLTRVMNFSRHGALAEIFVMDAVAKMAEKVAAAKPEALETGYISGHAWHGVAKEIAEAFKKRTGA